MGKVIVIGGGAAGMMAALAAAKKGSQVCLLEKNEKLGKKLFITGKGRCNVTNAADMETLFENVCTNKKFLYSAFYQYDNQAVMDFFERAGCPLKIERGDRVFPVSDHSSDIIGALFRELKRSGVEIVLNAKVEELMVDSCDGQADGGAEHEGKTRFKGVRLADNRVIYGDSCIVCTGGISYPSTGSTGDGYRFALTTGHKLVECRPALVPLETQESWCKELMGLSLRNVSVRFVCGKKEIYQGFGEMLFTHFGVSGPLIISASSFYTKRKADKEKVRLYIDLKPALDNEQLDKRL